MIYYLLLPFVSIVLVVFQNTMAHVLFSGWLTLELSMVFVIYAGFRLDMIQGMVLAFVMGLVFDCVSGSPLGLFTLIYLLIYILSFFVSWRIVSEKLQLIAGFSLICSLLESLLLTLIYYFVFKVEMLGNMFFAFVLQAILISFFSVGFFYAMRRIEGFWYGKTRKSPRRTTTGGISAEA